MKPKAAVIMGSDSDLKYMNPAIETLKDFKVPHEVPNCVCPQRPS